MNIVQKGREEGHNRNGHSKNRKTREVCRINIVMKEAKMGMRAIDVNKRSMERVKLAE